MISLKKYLDMDINVRESAAPELGELLSAVLAAYRSALLAMSKSGVRACPAIASDLQQNLANLENRLNDEVTPAQIQETEQRVKDELQQWGDRSEGYYKAKVDDVKEVLIVLARTAESVGERDKRYASHFNQFTNGLQTIANLEDITQVRATLVKKATELKTYVDQMAQDSQDLVVQLKGEVTSYETKLKAVEQLAMRDEVTGLPNRRSAESRIEWRVEHKQTFCLAVLDMNGFKQVNDKYGHPAGDHLLKQFAEELRSSLRSTDMVGRWGGDEFIIVLDCDIESARPQIQRVQKWVLGDYTIQKNTGEEVKVSANAAIGLVQWKSGETVKEVIARADAAMYQEKKLPR
ncbi:MAG TPA: GGDEF domain-containing protein [Terriglobales bacterium]|nr:GGDEF domain-containing protein [Terriglobales bacterium]